MSFGRSAREEAQYRQFHYPETDILINKLDIRDPRQLEALERYYVESRLKEGLPPDARQLTYVGLKAIHRHLFQDVYEWAGQERTYTTGRGPAPFAQPKQIAQWLEKQFIDLNAQRNLAASKTGRSPSWPPRTSTRSMPPIPSSKATAGRSEPGCAFLPATPVIRSPCRPKTETPGTTPPDWGSKRWITRRWRGSSSADCLVTLSKRATIESVETILYYCFCTIKQCNGRITPSYYDRLQENDRMIPPAPKRDMLNIREKRRLMRIPDYPSADAERWNAVDTYFSGLLAPDDAILTETLAANAKAGMPAHDVSALQGQMLALVTQMTGASRVLEIGTLGGYSTIRIARALPAGGTVVTIEANQRHAEIAKQNFARSDVEDRIDLRHGKALDVLPGLPGPFDLIFIDADKPNNPNYIRWALNLSRPGTVIVCDNVVRGGAVVESRSTDPNVQGVRSLTDIISSEPRLIATAIQTVGEKGWDGFILARVVS